MKIPEQVRHYWAEYEHRLDCDLSSRFYEAFHFDDNEEDANALAALVQSGIKRATAALLWTYEASQKPLPTPGCLSVVTNWAGEPLCIIETQAVEVVPFDEVTEEFAATEGEGDCTLSYWKKVHWLYFERECLRLGKKPETKMPVVCEKFIVVDSQAP